MANIYDAGDYEIRLLQGELAKNGISQDQLDLGNYAGLTYCELKGVVNAAIANKKREALTNGRQSSDTSKSSK